MMNTFLDDSNSVIVPLYDETSPKKQASLSSPLSSSSITSEDDSLISLSSGEFNTHVKAHPYNNKPKVRTFKTWAIQPNLPRKRYVRSLFGAITLHRFGVFMWTFLVTVVFFFLPVWIWPNSKERLLSFATKAPLHWTLLALIALVPLPSSILFLTGALWYRKNERLDKVQSMEHKVVFRIVSRGVNAECLLSTIHACQRVMQKTRLFPYLIEVVTDGDEYCAPDYEDVTHIRVPEEYQTAKGTQFKARALHYALQATNVSGDCWVVHLDEESHPTESAIRGIAKMITKCENDGNVKRIGQGMILYHRGWDKYPFLTLADMRRTGDDVGHFYLQHRLGVTIFGLHGSFVIVRQDVERRIGFDLGPDGSITEDAWWVLIAMEKGYRTMWVDGYFEEQCTQSLIDFVKQRKRWYVGLWSTAWKCPANLRSRMFLLFNTMSWMVLPFLLPLQMIYLYLLLKNGIILSIPIRLLGDVMLPISLLVYLSGLMINMKEHGIRWWKRPLWIILELILMPIFFVMEIAGVSMAIRGIMLGNANGFHVVNKCDHGDLQV